MTDDFFEKLTEELEAKRAGSDNTTWAPKKDKEQPNPLLGVMTRGDLVMTKNGESWLMEIAELGMDGEPTGEVYTVWCSAFMLKQQLMDTMPAKGTRLAVQYFGDKPTKNDATRSYGDFRIEAEAMDVEYWTDIRRKFSMKQEAAGSIMESRGPEGQSYGPGEDPF